MNERGSKRVRGRSTTRKPVLLTRTIIRLHQRFLPWRSWNFAQFGRIPPTSSSSSFSPQSTIDYDLDEDDNDDDDNDGRERADEEFSGTCFGKFTASYKEDVNYGRPLLMSWRTNHDELELKSQLTLYLLYIYIYTSCFLWELIGPTDKQILNLGFELTRFSNE